MQKHQRKSIEFLMLFILLAGIYIFPERIKYFSILFVGVSILIAIKKHWMFKTDYTVLAFVGYIVISILGSLAENVSFTNIIEFDVSLIMGLLVYGFWVSVEKREQQVEALISFGFLVIAGCLLQIVNINVLKQINHITLGAEKYEIFDMFYRGKSIVGFSFQTGVTGFYLSIISLCFAVFFLEEKKSLLKKYIYLICSGACVTLTFFTGKRIFILLVGLILLALVCVYYKKNAFKILFVSMLLAVVLYYLLVYTEYGQGILLKMSRDDITTGRKGISSQLIHWFWEAPVFGKGITSTLSLLKGYQNGHNIYLQILSESGIVGFILIVPVFVINMIRSIGTFLKLRSFEKDAKYCAICLAIQLLFVGWGFTGNPLYDVYPLIVYMVACGYINKYRQNEIVIVKSLKQDKNIKNS